MRKTDGLTRGDLVRLPEHDKFIVIKDSHLGIPSRNFKTE
jgi:hypothetical protein